MEMIYLFKIDPPYHINQLGELQLELNGDGVRDVDDGPHQLVVAGEQIVKQPLGVWVTLSQDWKLTKVRIKTQ